MRGGYDDRIPVRAGDVLAGKYSVERVLGSGGMGVVVAARHLRLDERVAIKFLHPDALMDDEAVARFEREARAAVKIKSEHVARVADVGTLDNGAPYMVMEYLEGEDLAEWVQQRGALPIEQAVEFVLQTCEAMAEAHGLGIIHRDLKPSNLFCIRRADGLLSIKVLDFGISKITRGPSAGMDMTATGAIMGSPLYMSPEQMKSARSVDARADIWAIGIILYELLSGRVPFRGETYPEVCMSIANQPTPSMRRARPEVPPNLEAVIAKCLQKDRTARFSNVAELAIALAPFAPKRARATVDRISRVIQSAGLSESALALPPSSNPSSESRTTTMASWGQTSPNSRRNRVGMASVAAVAVLGVGVAAARMWQASPPEPTVISMDAAAHPPLPLVTATASSAPTLVPAPPPPGPSSAAIAPTVSALTPDPLPASPRLEPGRSNRPAPIRSPSTSGPTPGSSPSIAVAPKMPAAPSHPLPPSSAPSAAAPSAKPNDLGGRL